MSFLKILNSIGKKETHVMEGIGVNKWVKMLQNRKRDWFITRLNS